MQAVPNKPKQADMDELVRKAAYEAKAQAQNWGGLTVSASPGNTMSYAANTLVAR